MKFGLYGINVGACADPTTAAEVARLAERVGFDSVWTGEHVVLPDPQAPPSPLPPRTPLLDPAVALAFVAAHTRTIRLATGIVILPQRNPLVLAKELASVDVVSGGRLLFGIGAGYLEPEFAALGIPFADRGRRTDEYLDAILALWDEPSPRFKGKFVAFSGIDANPRPVQRPHPPIHVGGQSRRSVPAGALSRERLVRLRSRRRKRAAMPGRSLRCPRTRRASGRARSARDHDHASAGAAPGGRGTLCRSRRAPPCPADPRANRFGAPLAGRRRGRGLPRVEVDWHLAARPRWKRGAERLARVVRLGQTQDHCRDPSAVADASACSPSLRAMNHASRGESRLMKYMAHASGEMGATVRLRWTARRIFSATRSGP